MRVPAPVLASTLEPEFLVVPTSSFSCDSPPTSASEEGGTDAVKTSSEILLVKRTVTSSSYDAPVSSTSVSTVTKMQTTVEPRGGQLAVERSTLENVILMTVVVPLNPVKTEKTISRDLVDSPVM